MKEFHINTEIFFGEKALDRLSQLPFDRVLIITDPFVVSSGMITLLTARLDKAHIDYDLFTDVVPDPPVEKVISGVATVMQTKPPLHHLRRRRLCHRYRQGREEVCQAVRR